MPKLECDSQCSLLVKTRNLIKDDGRPLVNIAVEIGVPFGWLTQIAYNNVNGPSVNRVQYLYEKLSGKKLI